MATEPGPTRADLGLLGVFLFLALTSYYLLGHRLERPDALEIVAIITHIAAISTGVVIFARHHRREEIRKRQLAYERDYRTDLRTFLPMTVIRAENILTFKESDCKRALYHREQIRRVNVDGVGGFSFRNLIARKTVGGEILPGGSVHTLKASDNLEVHEYPHPSGGVVVDAAFKEPPKKGDVVTLAIDQELLDCFPSNEEFLTVRIHVPTEVQVIRVISERCPFRAAWGDVHDPDPLRPQQPPPNPLPTSERDFAVLPQLLQPTAGTIIGIKGPKTDMYGEIEWRIEGPVVGALYALRWQWDETARAPHDA